MKTLADRMHLELKDCGEDGYAIGTNCKNIGVAVNAVVGALHDAGIYHEDERSDIGEACYSDYEVHCMAEILLDFASMYAGEPCDKHVWFDEV